MSSKVVKTTVDGVLVEVSVKVTNIDEPKTFGQQLKEIRLASGLTARNFAKLLNIQTSQLSRYENEVLIPGRNKMQSLAFLLGYNVEVRLVKRQ